MANNNKIEDYFDCSKIYGLSIKQCSKLNDLDEVVDKQPYYYKDLIKLIIYRIDEGKYIGIDILIDICYSLMINTKNIIADEIHDMLYAYFNTHCE